MGMSASACQCCLVMLLGLQSFALGAGNDANLHVNISSKSLHVMNLTCAEDNPYHDNVPFRMMQIAHLSGTGHKTVWITLNSTGHPLPSPDFLDTMGKRSYDATGRVSKLSSRLQILVYDPELDVHMRNYGTFNCSVWYHGQPKERRIGPTIEIIPGVGLPAQSVGFRVVVYQVVDLTCWANIPTQDFTLNMLRMSDDTVLASWKRSKILACSVTPTAVCSDLQYSEIKGVVYARVRLMDVSDLEAGYQCYIEINQEKHPSQVIRNTPNQMDSSHGYSTGTLIAVIITTVILSCFGTGTLFVIVMTLLTGWQNLKTLFGEAAEMMKPGYIYSQTPKYGQQVNKGSLPKGKK